MASELLPESLCGKCGAYWDCEHLIALREQLTLMADPSKWLYDQSERSRRELREDV
jgi:hypothetical protein